MMSNSAFPTKNSVFLSMCFVLFVGCLNSATPDVKDDSDASDQTVEGKPAEVVPGAAVKTDCDKIENLDPDRRYLCVKNNHHLPIKLAFNASYYPLSTNNDAGCQEWFDVEEEYKELEPGESLARSVPFISGPAGCEKTHKLYALKFSDGPGLFGRTDSSSFDMPGALGCQFSNLGEGIDKIHIEERGWLSCKYWGEPAQEGSEIKPIVAGRCFDSLGSKDIQALGDAEKCIQNLNQFPILFTSESTREKYNGSYFGYSTGWKKVPALDRLIWTPKVVTQDHEGFRNPVWMNHTIVRGDIPLEDQIKDGIVNAPNCYYYQTEYLNLFPIIDGKIALSFETRFFRQSSYGPRMEFAAANGSEVNVEEIQCARLRTFSHCRMDEKINGGTGSIVRPYRSQRNNIVCELRLKPLTP